MAGEITLANSGEWIDEIQERLYAHYLRVSEYLEREGLDWETWTLDDLRRLAPEWCAQGFHDMGWPQDLPIAEGADGCYFEPHELETARIVPDFRDRYFQIGAAPEEMYPVTDDPNWHIPYGGAPPNA